MNDTEENVVSRSYTPRNIEIIFSIVEEAAKLSATRRVSQKAAFLEPRLLRAIVGTKGR